MINNNVIFIVCCNLTLVGHKRRFGNWVYSLLQMIVVIILEMVIVITTIIIALNSPHFSWFSKSRVLLPKHVLSIILLQACAASIKCGFVKHNCSWSVVRAVRSAAVACHYTVCNVRSVTRTVAHIYNQYSIGGRFDNPHSVVNSRWTVVVTWW